MAGRRDLERGYRFGMRRGAGALLRADGDTAESTLRRLGSGTVGSIAVAVIAALVAAIAGALGPHVSPGSWQNGRTLIVSKQTGARYVYLDGALHPVLNYASALLILRSGAVTPTTVPQAQLDAVPRGPAIGIPGGPDVIPKAGDLLSGPWRVCSDPAVAAATGQSTAVVRFTVGGTESGTPVPSGGAVLIRADGGTELVWNGTRLRLADYATTALGYASASPPAVGDAWLDAVPEGPDLAAPAPPAPGTPGPDQTVVGRVYTVAGGGPAFYVAYPDGLAPITDVQERLLLADTALTSAAYGSASPAPIALTVAQAAAAPKSATDPAAAPGLPAVVPSLVNTGFPTGQPQIGAPAPAVCATLQSASQDTVTISTDDVAVTSVDASGGQPTDAAGGAVANSLKIPAGRGAVVRAVANASAAGGTLYLITDLGVEYPIAAPAVLTDLGLGSAAAVPLPEGFVRLLPAGPALDEVAAARPVP